MHDTTEPGPVEPLPSHTGAQPHVAPTFPLMSHLGTLIDEVRVRVPAAFGEWEPEAIHQSRVATRRLKAALDLLKPVLSKRPRRKLGRALRKLRRRLGPLRDADVMIDHLQDLGEASARHAPAATWLRQRLLAERDKLRIKALKGKRPASMVAKLDRWNPVRQEIESARDALDCLIAESLHLQLDAFAEQANRLAEVDAEPAGASSVEQQDPHALRISGKALRYTLEMAAAHGHDLPGSLTKTFKRMQDALGNWHDFVVLAEHATQAAIEEQLAHHAPALMSDLFDFVRDVLAKSADDLSDFKQLWRDQGGGVCDAVRRSFPLTRSVADAPVTESQRGPDPSGSGSPEPS